MINMTKVSTIESIKTTMKVIQTSNSKGVVEGAIKRLAACGFTKEQIEIVLRNKTTMITRA
jgi:hypothetical protein